MPQSAIQPSMPTASPETESAVGLARGRRDVLVLFSVLLLTWVVAYLPVLRTLADQWATNDTYSFGVLVPFISAYLVWLRRERLQTIPLVPQVWAGLPIVLVAGALLVIGRVTAIVGIQEISLVLMLVGLIVLMLGGRMLRELWFPLAYLLLMLPIWDALTDRLHRQSQLFSAALAQHLLQAIGVPVHREDVYLAVPNLTIEVASACSGVNFLIAVLMIGVPQAYLYLRGLLPRIAVVVFAVGIAFLSNGLRVAIIAVLAYHHWSASLHGPWHMLQGLFVSSVGFIAIFAGVTVLAKRYPPENVHPPIVAPSEQGFVASRWKLVAAGLIAAALLAALPVFNVLPLRITSTSDPSIPPLPRIWRAVGMRPARFVGHVRPDEAMSCVFEGPAGERIDLYIGSLAYNAADSRLDYRSVALPSSVTPSQFDVSRAGMSPARVNKAEFREADRKLQVFFWYNLNGRMTVQPAVAKAHAMAGLVTGIGSLPHLVVVSTEHRLGDRDPSDDLARFVRDVSVALSAARGPETH